MPLDGFSGDEREFELTTQPVTGVRAFRQEGLGRLTGVTYSSQVFRPGVNVSRCVNSTSGGHHARADRGMDECDCGYYAYYGDTDKKNFFNGTVGGIIQATGKIVVGTKGFRAEKAELVALFPLRSVKKSPARFLYWSHKHHLRQAKSGVSWPEGALGFILFFIGAQALFGTIAACVLYGWAGLLVLPFAGLQFLWFVGAASRWLVVEDLQDRLKSRKILYHTPSSADPELDLARLTWGSPPLEDRFGRLSELYPDVPIYRSRAEAERAHPPTSYADVRPPEPPTPTPANTDGFWDLPVDTGAKTKKRSPLQTQMQIQAQMRGRM